MAQAEMPIFAGVITGQTSGLSIRGLWNNCYRNKTTRRVTRAQNPSCRAWNREPESREIFENGNGCRILSKRSFSRRMPVTGYEFYGDHPVPGLGKII